MNIKNHDINVLKSIIIIILFRWIFNKATNALQNIRNHDLKTLETIELMFLYLDSDIILVLIFFFWDLTIYLTIKKDLPKLYRLNLLLSRNEQLKECLFYGFDYLI